MCLVGYRFLRRTWGKLCWHYSRGEQSDNCHLLLPWEMHLHHGNSGRMRMVMSMRQWVRTVPKRNWLTLSLHVPPLIFLSQMYGTGQHWNNIPRVLIMNQAEQATSKRRIGMRITVSLKMRQYKERKESLENAMVDAYMSSFTHTNFRTFVSTSSAWSGSIGLGAWPNPKCVNTVDGVVSHHIYLHDLGPEGEAHRIRMRTVTRYPQPRILRDRH